MTGTLTAVVYGDPGVGKTPVALTVPAPVLLLDAEGGAMFVPGRKVHWNPRTEQPPAADGTWDICVVAVIDWATMTAAADYLRAGRHEFVSIVLDSVTELQARCKRQLISEGRTGRSTEQIWGFILDDMTDVLRDVHDTRAHPSNPTRCVVFTAAAVEKGGKVHPDVQGALIRKLPRIVDVVGYLYTADDEFGEPSADPASRRLLIAPRMDFVAKDRTSSLPNGGLSGLLGVTIGGPLDFSAMVSRISEE